MPKKITRGLWMTLKALFLFAWFLRVFSKVKPVWTSSSPLFSSSFALKKNSPYTKFFTQAFKDVKENGQLYRYSLKNSEISSDCSPTLERGNPLGFSKLASIFFILIFGIILSFLIFIFEHCKKPEKNTNFVNQEILDLENSLSNLIPFLKDELERDAEDLLKQARNQRC